MNIQVANPVTMGNAWISGFICYANALYAVPGTGTGGCLPSLGGRE